MRARLAASAALATVLAVGLVGCTLLTPQATLKQYDPSDGVGAKVGDVDIVNAIAIAGDTSSTSTDANLVFSAVNSSDSSIRLRVQYPSGERNRTRTVEVGPGITKVGYGDDGQFLLTGFHPRPGALAKIYFQYGSQQGKQVTVPVLNDSWSSFKDLGPTPTPTPTPSTTSTNPPVTPAPIPPAGG